MYFLTSNAEDDAIKEVQTWKSFDKLTKGKNNLIIMENWNAILIEGVDDQELATFGLGTRNEKGDHLVNFCRQHNMTIAKIFQNIHHRKKYTWKMPWDIRRYQINFIIVRKRFRNQIYKYKTYSGTDVNSDQNLLMMKYYVVYKKLTRITQKSKKYFLILLKDNNINIAYIYYIIEKLKLNPPFPNDTTEDKWNKIKDVINEAANNMLKKNSPKSR